MQRKSISNELVAGLGSLQHTVRAGLRRRRKVLAAAGKRYCDCLWPLMSDAMVVGSAGNFCCARVCPTT